MTHFSKEYYLSMIKVDSFGAMSQRTVGRFGPKLNVVYGRNEAGKTTIGSFVGGVLFGWEEKRGNRNTYKPENAERSGTLFFSPRTNADARQGIGFGHAEGLSSGTGFDEDKKLWRTRNADGLQGDDYLVDDIDKDTYRTMFSLTSDELLDLDRAADVTAKLLTAGSGTGASPAEALILVRKKLETYSSRAEANAQSITRLTSQQEEVREQIAQAAAEAEDYKQKNRDFRGIEPQRTELTNRLATINDEIKQLTKASTTTSNNDEQCEVLKAELEGLLAEERRLDAAFIVRPKEEQALIDLSSGEERVLRGRIDAMASDETKSEQIVANAKENFLKAKHRFEALKESSAVKEQEERERKQRPIKIATFLLMPIVLLAFGGFFLWEGTRLASLTLSMVGISIIVCGVVMAVGAIVVLTRPSKSEEQYESDYQDYQWVMLQDKKAWEQAQRDHAELRASITEMLDANGLAQAEGSLAQARDLLDNAQDERMKESQYYQRRQANASRIADIKKTLNDYAKTRKQELDALRLAFDTPVEHLERLIERKVDQRDGIQERLGLLNAQYGELKQALEQARHAKGLDELKLKDEQLQAAIEASTREYAKLVLVEEMLKKAIAAWDMKSQPEVYARASSLMSAMTGGRWEKISMTPEGRLVATDSMRNELEPVNLSLATCQQLYLSLRIALLLTADNVGRAIPILADDILVNFDAERRIGAAVALSQLSQSRQVILFTCHREVVDVFRSVDAGVNVIEL